MYHKKDPQSGGDPFYVVAQIPDNDMEMVIRLTTRKRVNVTSKQCTKIKTLTKCSTM